MANQHSELARDVLFPTVLSTEYDNRVEKRWVIESDSDFEQIVEE